MRCRFSASRGRLVPAIDRTRHSPHRVLAGRHSWVHAGTHRYSRELAGTRAYSRYGVDWQHGRSAREYRYKIQKEYIKKLQFSNVIYLIEVPFCCMLYVVHPMLSPHLASVAASHQLYVAARCKLRRAIAPARPRRTLRRLRRWATTCPKRHSDRSATSFAQSVCLHCVFALPAAAVGTATYCGSARLCDLPVAAIGPSVDGHSGSELHPTGLDWPACGCVGLRAGESGRAFYEFRR